MLYFPALMPILLIYAPWAVVDKLSVMSDTAAELATLRSLRSDPIAETAHVDVEASFVPGDVPDMPDLHFAAQRGDLATVRRLVDQGADVNERDEDGTVALHWAAFHNHY